MSLPFVERPLAPSLGPSAVAGGAMSVFAGADVCATAGLTLLLGAVRPVDDTDLWDLCGLADAPTR